MENLSVHEIKYISSIEEIISSCEQHGRADYFHVSKEALGPIYKKHGCITRANASSLFESPFYKVVRDLVERYRTKCLPNMTKELFDKKSKK